MTKQTKKALGYLTGEKEFFPRPDWSQNYGECIKCGKTKYHHKSRGLCKNCYDVIQKYNKLWRLKTRITTRWTDKILEDINILQEKIKQKKDKMGENFTPNGVVELSSNAIKKAFDLTL